MNVRDPSRRRSPNEVSGKDRTPRNQRFGCSWSERLGEQKALSIAATNVSQLSQLTARLDTFSDDVRSNASRQRDDALDDGGLLMFGVEAADKRPIDLERVDREPVELAQRRVP